MRRLLTVITMAVIVLAGCGGDEETPPGDRPTDTRTTQDDGGGY